MPARARSAYTPAMSPEAVKAKTGRTWNEWFKVLDAWGAAAKGHKATAAWLGAQHGVPGWWCQNITVEYERARGLREVGQRTSGDFEVTATRTVDVDLAALKAAWLEARTRGKWLKDPELRPAVTAGMRTPRTSTTKLADMVRVGLQRSGAAQREKLELSFTTKPNGKAAVALAHTGITHRQDRDRLKALWKDALDAMKAHLEKDG